MVTVLMILLALGTGILLSGCASINKRKDAEPETESPGQVEQQSATGEEARGSSPEVLGEPVVYTGSSGVKPYIQSDSRNTDEGSSTHNSAYLLNALDRILHGRLPELNWNRIFTILGGVLVMSMIYGLAFALGRLPARRRSAFHRESGG
jgi:hypothetical protein